MCWEPSRFRVRSVLLALWPSTRVVWALGAIAFLLATSQGIAIFAPLGYALFALLAIATAFDALRIAPPRTLSIRRVPPEHLALRRSVPIRYEIENRSKHSLRIGFVEAPMRTLDFGELESVAIIPGRSIGAVETSALAVARGTDRFSRVHVWYETMLGLVRRRAVYDLPEEIRVYPDLAAVERYGSLHMRNKLIEAGLRRMRLRGQGSEFESLREYATGDAFRTIDWKATARRGKLMVMNREVERSQDVLMLVDCGRLMTARVGEQRKLDYAITAGLSLASIASLASDRVGVIAFARDILVGRSPRSTAASVRELANALCDVEPRFEESDYARAFTFARARLHRRSLIVLFTDVIDAVAQSMILAELSSLAKRHVVMCVLMNDAAVAKALSDADPYRQDVAIGLMHERTLAAKTLERGGIIVVDTPAEKLSMATIDQYLRVKSRGVL